MTKFNVSTGLILLLILTSCSVSDRADMILYNGKVITVDDHFTTAQAVAISGDRIVKVGANRQVLQLSGPDTRVIDLEGKTVLPGLIDAHLHPPQAAVSEIYADIPESTRSGSCSTISNNRQR